MRIRYAALMTTIVAALLFTSRHACADATAFVGVTTSPSTRVARGFAAGISLIIVGFEFEYSDTAEDEEEAAPSLRTGMANVLLQTPNVGSIQLYATAGGGFFRERLGTAQETHVGVNTGAGIKVPLLGPLRLRVDYRVFKLRGTPLHSQTQRVYAGLNLMF